MTDASKRPPSRARQPEATHKPVVDIEVGGVAPSRERVEATREQLEEQLRFQAQLLDSVRESLIATDLDGRVTYWGKGAQALYGYTAAEVMGKPVTLIVRPEDASDEFARMRQVSESGSWRGQYMQLRKDGRCFWADTMIALVRDDAGEPFGYIGIDRDITARKEAQDKLREAELRYRTLFRQSPDAIIIIDPDTMRPIEFNDVAMGLLGYSREQFAAIPFTEHEIIPSADEIRAHLQRILAEGVAEFDTRLRTQDGRILDVLADVQAIELAGRPVFHAVLRDISERRRAQDRAERLHNELAHVARVSTLGEMAAGLAHELSQPLTVILSYTRGCAEDIAAGTDPQTLLPRLHSAGDAAERAGGIIRGLWNLVCKTESRRSPADVNELITEILVLLNSEVRHHYGRLQFRPGDDLPQVFVDRIQVQQVVLNLVRNGCEAMHDTAPELRRMTITTSRIDADTVRVTVADAGPGVPADVADRLFDAFVTTKEDGLGMGLTISRSIIEAHGGRLTAEPDEDGGTLVSFTLGKKR